METKQTAVEWLVNKINSDNYQKAFGQTYISVELIEQAKQMEKEQIIDAHIYGDENHTFNSSKIEEYANDYYNETYGKEKS